MYKIMDNWSNLQKNELKNGKLIFVVTNERRRFLEPAKTSVR